MNNKNEKRNEKANEFIEKMVSVSRCTKVVAGGRRFSFSVLVVVGDHKGRVGIGLGKANEVMDARSKASAAAKKAMFRVPLKAKRTIHYDVKAKFCSGRVVMRSAPSGTGIIAGGAVRSMLEVLGVKDIVVKSVGSSNPHNMLKAAVVALKSMVTPSNVADRRSKDISQLLGSADNQSSVASEGAVAQA